MSTSKKVLLSLLITIILSTAFTGFAFFGLFDLIETSFYNPAVTAHMVNENNRNAKVVEEFFKSIESRLSETLKTDAVRRSLVYDQSQEDFSAIYNIFSLLGNSFEGNHWVRLIDSSGKRLYFSNYDPDIINHDNPSPAYHSYNEPDLLYDLMAVQNGGAPKHSFDNKSGSIIFSFPLYDSFDIYCGTALFSLSMDAILEKLFSEGRIITGHETILIQKPPGIVFGTMAVDEWVTPNQISSVWETTGLKTARVSSSDSDAAYILISTKTSQGLFIGSLIKEELYLFPWSMKLILLISFFLTMYLTIFLLFSLKQEPVTIIQDRLKRLQVSLLEQFYESKDEEDWNRWIREMKYRREEISALLKQGIRPASGSLNEEIDILINKSWNEFLTMLGSRREPGFDEGKLRSALNSMLAALPKAGKDLLSGGEVSPKKVKTGLLGKAEAIVKEIDETDPVEELEELEEPEDLESKETAEVDIDALASQIEFSPETQPESTEDESIEHDLEIVSPFSAMLDDFTDTIDYEDPEKEVETIQSRGNVIKEKGGLPFVSTDALNPDEKEAEFINRDFKNLVDSVIKD